MGLECKGEIVNGCKSRKRPENRKVAYTDIQIGKVIGKSR